MVLLACAACRIDFDPLPPTLPVSPPEVTPAITSYFIRNDHDGTQPVTSAGATDIVIAVLEPGGAVRWVTTFGDPGADEGRVIAVAADGTTRSGLLDPDHLRDRPSADAGFVRGE